ncbi:MAG TPA: hypothetical protein VIP11_12095, partial [Gemmatimonadaceae bacterium]
MSSSDTETRSVADACDGCTLIARRDFLRDAAFVAASALVALGVTPAAASASPVGFIESLGGSREEKAYPIPAADGTQIDKANDAIITRWEGKVYAYS